MTILQGDHVSFGGGPSELLSVFFLRSPVPVSTIKYMVTQSWVSLKAIQRGKNTNQQALLQRKALDYSLKTLPLSRANTGVWKWSLEPSQPIENLGFREGPFKECAALRKELFRKFPAGVRRGVRFLNFSHMGGNQVPALEAPSGSKNSARGSNTAAMLFLSPLTWIPGTPPEQTWIWLWCIKSGFGSGVMNDRSGCI